MALLQPQFISLTTDFGLRNISVGLLRSLIARHYSKSNIIDFSHSVKPGKPLEGKYILENLFTTLPPGSLHFFINDIFSTENNPLIIVEFGQHYFIGPDNGVFAAIFQGRSYKAKKINDRWNMDWHLDLHNFLNNIHNSTNWESIAYPEYTLIQKDFLTVFKKQGLVRGQVYYTDDAGNAITNIHRSHVESIFKDERILISFGGTSNINKISSHPGENTGIYSPFAIYNEFDFLVLGFKYNNFAKLFDILEGHDISITLQKTALN